MKLHDLALSMRGYLSFARPSNPTVPIVWGRTPKAADDAAPIGHGLGAPGERVVMPWSKAPSGARHAATVAKLDEARRELAPHWPRETMEVSGDRLYLQIPQPERPATVAVVRSVLDRLPTRGYRARSARRWVEVEWLPEHAVGHLDRRVAGGRPKGGDQ